MIPQCRNCGLCPHLGVVVSPQVEPLRRPEWSDQSDQVGFHPCQVLRDRMPWLRGKDGGVMVGPEKRLECRHHRPEVILCRHHAGHEH